MALSEVIGAFPVLPPREKVANALVILDPVVLGPWLDVLRGVRHNLTGPLASIFKGNNPSESNRTLASSILVDFAAEEPEIAADALMAAEPQSFLKLFPVVELRAERAVPVFQAELAKCLTTDGGESELATDRLAERQARAAIALVRLGKAESIWPLLRHSPDPRLRSFVTNWLAPLGVEPKVILVELRRLSANRQPAPAPDRLAMEVALLRPETSIRRALLIALGTYGPDAFSSVEREPLVATLFELYKNDPDAGVHGAAEWTLRQWKQQAKLEVADAELSRLKDRGRRRWYVKAQMQTFTVIEGPVEFQTGSRPTEPDRGADEIVHRGLILRRFAIASKEVSVEQHQKFVQESPQFRAEQSDLEKYARTPDSPVIGCTWFTAVAYCNWLSKQEGLPPDQWCYAPNDKGKYDAGMTVPDDSLQRKGYRLPSEAEWEYACRAGATTSRYYGFSVGLLSKYARHHSNRQDRTWPCGLTIPNDLGLFDTLGNAYEWCGDRFERHVPAMSDAVIDVVTKSEVVDISLPRSLRGGSFYGLSADARAAARDSSTPADCDYSLGIRLARTCN